MATLHVKELDDRLYAAFITRAAADRRTISQEVVFMIEEFLARPAIDHRAATAEVLELAGSWEDDRSPSQIVSDLRKARSNR